MHLQVFVRKGFNAFRFIVLITLLIGRAALGRRCDFLGWFLVNPRIRGHYVQKVLADLQNASLVATAVRSFYV